MDIEDPEQLLLYLGKQHTVQREEVTDIEILHGGVSNRTVLLRRREGTDWVLKQALEKLRVPDDWFSDPLRIHREAEGMRCLKPLLPDGYIVDLIIEDFEHHIIAMEAVEQPFTNWKSDLLTGNIVLPIVEQFGRCLAGIHKEFNLDQYDTKGILRDREFFESLRIEPYYLRTAQQSTEASLFMHALIKDTRNRTLTLVHGDYSPKNILVRQGKMILLDHEVIHVGDPAFDLGFSLTHLLSKANHLIDHRTSFFEAASRYWSTYVASLGEVNWIDSMESMCIRHTIGCMLARIVGRSPLEYLAPEAQINQQKWCLQSMNKTPSSMDDLIESFNEYLNKCL